MTADDAPTGAMDSFPNGTCAEAMPFSAGIFGALDLQMMRYNQAPSTEGAGGASDRVMHSQMTAMGSTLMASDYPPGMGEPQAGMPLSQLSSRRVLAC